ncbi:enoyl-CoA delta isomerase 1, mitochondrial-like isoform X2 [Tubulanus polymorphus]|uniref:enoyl-CoA delta isomerase 1, mitochondrial-like isoform X2 n=1 Tax=Tubulanus polymorphus TaxID=672921 RepID=UPI003DA2DF3E
MDKIRRITPILSISQKSKCFQKMLSSSPAGNVTVDKQEGLAVLKMHRKPVNSLNTEFLKELTETLDSLEKDKETKGVILTSGIPKIFSAGLDIMEMYNSTDEKVRDFWFHHQSFWMKLYGSKLFTIAQINGQSPAGGCAMAISCDYRVMGSEFRIGLNETHLGIVAPTMYQDTLVSTVGQAQAELVLGLGEMWTADEAQKIGMVNVVCPVKDIEEKTRAAAAKWMNIPVKARYLSKIALRQPVLDKLMNNRQADIDYFAQFIQTPAVQKSIEVYLQNLKKKSK